MKEQWKDINGYNGFYQISNTGKVRSIERCVKARGNSLKIIPGKEMVLSLNSSGYQLVSLYKDGKRKNKLVHRLVAEAFIINDDPINKKEVNHIDFDKTNNNVSNLEWCTRRYNMQYGCKESSRRGPVPRKVRCINNGMIFDSIRDAADYIGLKNTSPLYKCCMGDSKSSGVVDGKPGRWEFIN